jgi:hypothetical protein
MNQTRRVGVLGVSIVFLRFFDWNLWYFGFSFDFIEVNHFSHDMQVIAASTFYANCVKTAFPRIFGLIYRIIFGSTQKIIENCC